MLTSAEKSNQQNMSFLKMAVIFDLNKIFQFCFDILKGNRNIIFNINFGFFMKTKIILVIFLIVIIIVIIFSIF